jgi:hypothetical protein
MDVPWPDKQPPFRPLYCWPDSLYSFAQGVLALGIQQAANYLELGSYCGASALLVSQYAPHLNIACIDTFDCRGDSDYSHTNTPLDSFLHHLWPSRHRIRPVQATTLAGMHYLHASGFQPDIIYVDADHSLPAATADIATAKRLWPDAQICGDDFHEVGVCQAVVDTLAPSIGLLMGRFWWEVRPQPIPQWLADIQPRDQPVHWDLRIEGDDHKSDKET